MFQNKKQFQPFSGFQLPLKEEVELGNNSTPIGHRGLYSHSQW
jgi:hypothetical protein